MNKPFTLSPARSRANDIERTMIELCTYYGRTRGAGHTSAMVNGIGDGRTFVLSNHPSSLASVIQGLTHERRLTSSQNMKPNLYQVIGFDDLRQALAGQRVPLLIDHDAVCEIMLRAGEEIDRLKRRIRELNNEVTSLKGN